MRKATRKTGAIESTAARRAGEDAYSYAEFDAHRVHSIDAYFREPYRLGTFLWVFLDGEVIGLCMALPRTAGRPEPTGTWRVYKRGEPKPPGVAWEWDGNLDKPTLTPSLHLVGYWHGFLTAGRFTIRRPKQPKG